MTISTDAAKSKLLDLLIFFDEFCKRNNFEYWIDGGTLLGAKRQKGFIPWDDDIDVCILEKDFDNLIIQLEKEVRKTKSYFLYNSARHYPSFSDFLADSSVIKSNLLPIRIDLLKVKSSVLTTEILKKDQSVINVLKYYINFDYSVDEITEDIKTKFYDDKRFSARKKFTNYFNNVYLKELQQTKDSTSDLKYNYVFNDIYVKKSRPWYNHETIYPLKEIEFENYKFSCPNNVDQYLTILYGPNFITPPPKEEQVPYSAKNIKHFFPKFIIKKWTYVIYYLKEIKNWRKIK